MAPETPLLQQDNDASASQPRAIVGLGASAGGVQALKTFFEHMPADSGLAFVCILHLSPDYESHLAEIIATTTQMPVAQIMERMRIEADHVYVIAPNAKLTVADGHLVVSDFDQPLERCAPIDLFLRTLAVAYGSQAIACILSGTGANGSVGIKAIKEQGGIVLAQDPQETEYDGMARHAIATGLVDCVLPVGQMPSRIISYEQQARQVHLAPKPLQQPVDAEAALHEIFTILRVRTGHDFSNYKRATLLRRIERRMHVSTIGDIAQYSDYLRDHIDETEALLKDLLISVTNFFRDPEAFALLERDVIPRLFAGKTEGDQVRIWVAGCATGEEAYSLAMLAQEQVTKTIGGPTIQVFATDIDEHAIAAARYGFYSETAVADLTPERLRRFFVHEGNGYRVNNELREKVMFAQHNLLKDPPFSNLDLASCRNLLIYLNRHAQEYAISAFYFALRPNGYLLLGSSESVDATGDRFVVLDREHRIFQKRGAHQAALPVPDRHALVARPFVPRGQPVLAPDACPVSYGELHLQLLEHYAPPSIVVNDTYEIVHLSEHAGRFLQHTGGEPTHNLLRVVRPELRLELHTALLQAQQYQQPAEARDMLIHANGSSEHVTISVHPARTSRPDTHGLLLVIFESARVDDATAEPNQSIVPEAEPAALRIEEELGRLRERLRLTIDQYEISVEEYRASNEELQALNEELRAASEELETSKEELQSVNEELRTVNQELTNNIDELSHANNDLRNLIGATNIATVFLDRTLRVKLFTPSATSIFNLLQTDIRRPLAHITHRLKHDDLLEAAGNVLEDLQTIERETETRDGRWFLLRMLPYRNADNHIDGVVMTFTDISARKHAEEHLQAMIGQALAGIVESDLTGKLTFVNDRFCELVGYTRQELLQMRRQDLIHPDDAQGADELLTRLVDDRMPFESEKRYRRKAGSLLWSHDYVSAIRDAQGRPQTIVTVSIDISERKQAEATQAHFRQLFESAPGAYLVLEPETYRIAAASDAYLQATMTERAEIVGKDIFEAFPDDPQVPNADGIRNLHASFERVKANRQADVMAVQIYPIRRPNGDFEERWWSPINSPVFGATGELAYIIHRIEDVTPFVQKMRQEGREAEGFQQLENRAAHMEAEIVLRTQELQRANEQLRESENLVRLATEAAHISTWSIDIASCHIRWSSSVARTLDLAENIVPQHVDEIFGLVYAAQRNDVRQHFARALERGGELDVEFRLQTSPDTWLRLTGSTLDGASGKPVRMLGVIQNITGRKHAEEERERLLAAERTAREQAEAAVRVRDQFLSIASHELRTPLTPLLGYMGMIEQYLAAEAPPDSRVHAQIRAVVRQANRLNTLVGGFLDVSRLQRGQFIVERQPLDFGTLVAQAVEDYRLTQPTAPLSHVLQMTPPGAPVLVLGDPARLEEVVCNLLSNAIKYSPNGGTIDVRVTRQGTDAVLEIKDQGIGIPEHDLAHLFETFYRAGNVGTQLSGFGLGLYIVQQIVARHDGRIEVESTEKAGSTFRIVIPLQEDAG